MSEAVLQACDLGRRHRQGPLDVTVLASVDLSVAAGESVAIVGASGSGKSSLLHVLAGLDRPTQGRVLWQGQDVATLTASQVASRRNHWLGFVFQFHHLLSEFNALENAAMPLWVRRMPTAEAADLARGGHNAFDTYRQPDPYWFDPSMMATRHPKRSIRGARAHPRLAPTKPPPTITIS